MEDVRVAAVQVCSPIGETLLYSILIIGKNFNRTLLLLIDQDKSANIPKVCRRNSWVVVKRMKGG
jgi:hypothetical protein